MKRPKIFVHGSYVGTTGYNNHTRDFFRELSKYVDLKIRNFTVGKSWDGHSDRCHDGEKYLDDLDKKLLYQQILWTGNNTRGDFPIYSSSDKEFDVDFNIVLNETNHYLYYDDYYGPKIAYNVWESTLQPNEFFNRLKEFDELWVPSKWQRDCTIAQGYPADKIKVVPEGVDVKTFFPEKTDILDEYKDGRFKFLLFGRWDYRKSTKEIIETFLKTFSKDEPVDLVVSIDNVWGEKLDGNKSTEERLKSFGLDDPRIKILHFPSREDYVKYLKTGHVFVSCARSEGWNLPLIEAMACGTPSIYSNCCAQLEFAENKGLPVKIAHLKSANQNSYSRFTISEVPGDYYEPDFEDLSKVMRYSYENYDQVKQRALFESEEIRKNFSWERIGEIGIEAVNNFYNKITDPQYIKTQPQNQITISYLNGPRVSINGEKKLEYLVEFIDADKNEVVHSQRIKNNMWTECGRKYYTNWLIKINGEEVDRFNCNGRRVLISFESKSMGDTLAWAPYAVDFAKKHNCKVILSTFHNDWFQGLKEYENIEFIKPGGVTEAYAVYRIGWFRDEKGLWNKFDRYPNMLNTVPLQQTATDILGLPYYELTYGVDYKKKSRPINKKYIVFGPNSTAGAKEWTYENWVELSKRLIEMGYEVVTLTKSPYKINNVKNICNKPIQEVMNWLHHADLFIGLGSGLSWLNWSLGKKTVMICGFSQDDHEFKSNMIRVSNNVCIKCWNDPVLAFDAGDWDWCPVYKGTTKQHICQKSITVEQVLNKIISNI